MKFCLCENYDMLSKTAADEIAAVLKKKPNAILGLATGSTPIGTYKELQRRYEAGELDFSKASSFNLDEYFPIDPENEQSYRYFMNENLFSKINLPIERTHVPNGAATDPEEECKAYDAAIEEAGGIDIQILGIGGNGHIAFNEPDEYLYAGTHVTGLTESTIQANSRFFASADEVPRHALTSGMGTILRARKILILINGKAKHEALDMLRDDRITTQSPATFLKVHPDVTVICDREADQG